MSSAKRYPFTSESVSMGHPDKVADQISDAILDFCLKHDPTSRVACETLVTTNLAVVAGEITTKAPLKENVEKIVRGVIKEIGYTDPEIRFADTTAEVQSVIHAQSPHISQGVDKDGAGDQGMMFGFACDETPEFMPLPIAISHRLVNEHARLRREGILKWARPDAKSQVTVDYDDHGTPLRITTVVLSTQHDKSVMETKDGEDYFSDAARKEVLDKLIEPVLKADRADLIKGKLVLMPPAGQPQPNVGPDDIKVYVNPTGCFEVGGPDGDCGLTGRKIIVDTYGGRGRHGGGAFSGKDPSKVDRSAAYMARHVAKNIVAAGLAKRCEVQLAYAIGIAEPMSVLVRTEGTGVIPDEKIAEIVKAEFKLTPKGIREHLDLRRPIYQKTASGGHFGRSDKDFTWEHTDHVDALKKAAGI